METFLNKNFRKIDYYISKSVKETNEYAYNFATTLKQGNIVGVIGELGTGKTHFIKGAAKAFGIEKNLVISPTFNLIKEYNGKVILYHFDFYRLKNIKELYDIGFRHYFENEKSVIFIEWADKIKEIYGNYSHIIKMENVGKQKRKITVYANKIK